MAINKDRVVYRNRLLYDSQAGRHNIAVMGKDDTIHHTSSAHSQAACRPCAHVSRSPQREVPCITLRPFTLAPKQAKFTANTLAAPRQAVPDLSLRLGVSPHLLIRAQLSPPDSDFS